MTLFETIVQGASTCGDDVDATLRSALILASRLGYEPFQFWVDNELSGYSREAELPSYRTVPTGISFVAVSAGSQQKGMATYEFYDADEKAREAATRLELRVSAVELASWKREADDVRVATPPYVEYVIAQYLKKQRFSLVSSRQVIPKAAVERALSGVCVALLKFALEIEKLFPEVAEKRLIPTAEQTRDIRDAFNQVVVNGGNPTISIASGSGATATAIGLDVKIKLATDLTDYLRANGLVIDDLADVIEDATIADVNQPNSGVGQWLERARGAGQKVGKMVAEEGAKAVLRAIMTGQINPEMFTSFFM